MLNYELACALKDAGFVTNTTVWYDFGCDRETVQITCPTLSELIEACGEDNTIRLQAYWNKNDKEWQADTCGNFSLWDISQHKAEVGSTPEIAVARLWLALNKK